MPPPSHPPSESPKTFFTNSIVEGYARLIVVKTTDIVELVIVADILNIIFCPSKHWARKAYWDPQPPIVVESPGKPKSSFEKQEIEQQT